MKYKYEEKRNLSEKNKEIYFHNFSREKESTCKLEIYYQN